MNGHVVLVRHPPVTRAWAGRCYGRSDMGLSRAGAAMVATLAGRLADVRLDMIVHSGAVRTRRLAAAAARPDAAMCVDARWLERDFGAWEGRRWQAIWRESGDLMDRMMTDPHGFRPGGGETGAELSRRVAAAWADLPAGNVLIVAHGGSIAALRCRLAGAALERMIDFVPACGEMVTLSRRTAR